MPYWFKYYVVENLLFVLLYYCLRYRMKVVKTNLRNSFPEKSERELAVIRRRFYRTLSEIFVDTINMAYMNEEKGRTVLTVKDVEKHVEAVHGRDWIAMTAHFGCWEYCSYWGLYERRLSWPSTIRCGAALRSASTSACATATTPRRFR